MTDSTDLTTAAAGAMAPEDVPAALVDAAWGEFLAYPGDVGEDMMRSILATVLPAYGAAVIASAGVEHYDRQVELARSLTTRTYGAALLFRLADEATQAAAQGLEPALNRKLAEMLRTRARAEGVK